MAGTKRNLRATGALHEKVAVEFLKRYGVRIVDQNFHAGRWGEIDIIGYDGSILIFVEVKYRSSSSCGDPAQAVTRSKQRTIYTCAQFYMRRRNISMSQQVRFDVIAITKSTDNRDYVRWIRDAFWV